MSNKKRIFMEKQFKDGFSFTIVPPPSHFFVNKIELTLSLEQLKDLRDEIDRMLEPTTPEDKRPTET